MIWTYCLGVRNLSVGLIGLSEPPASSSLFEDELFEVEVVVALGGSELGLSLLVRVSWVLDGPIFTGRLLYNKVY